MFSHASLAEASADVLLDSCIISEGTKMSESLRIAECSKLTVYNSQITCLFDMDIVFQPNGNFDEVYLYVRGLSWSPARGSELITVSRKS